jgi:hypothetical protein
MVFLEIWRKVYIPKNLDTTNMKLLLDIEEMFNKLFKEQPNWIYDNEHKMYYTHLMIGVIIPFLTSDNTIKKRFNALAKYGFLDNNLKPFTHR